MIRDARARWAFGTALYTAGSGALLVDGVAAGQPLLVLGGAGLAVVTVVGSVKSWPRPRTRSGPPAKPRPATP